MRKRSVYNLVYGLASQFVMLLLAILVPRLLIVNLGSEINGLLSSVNQMLAYLAMLEAGVGTVTIQALYKPSAEENRDRINEIISATNVYYRKAGVLYLLALTVCAVTYPFAVQTEIPRATVMGVILLSGGSGMLTFLVHGKYTLLLKAEGKQYILSVLSTVIHLLTNLGKIALLLNGFDAVAVQMSCFLMAFAQSMLIYFYMRRHYWWIDLKVKPDFDAISQKNAVLLHQICGLIFNNTDTILLSLTWGLKYVSVYSVYSLIFLQLSNVIDTVVSSVMAALGQLFQMHRKAFVEKFEMLEFGVFALVFAVASICLLLIEPFIRLYTSGVADVDYLNVAYPILFAAVFLLSCLRGPAQTVITVAGHFQKTQSRAVFEAAINIFVSVALLWRFGIVGVLIGTVTALLYRTNDMIIYSNSKILKRKNFTTYWRLLRNLLLLILCVCVGKGFAVSCTDFISLLKWAILEGSVVMLFFAGVNLLSEPQMVGKIWGILTPSSGTH